MSQPRKDAYAKRALTSIAAPPADDSDSDFRPGAYIPEPKVKKKGRHSASSPARKKQRIDATGNAAASSKLRKNRTRSAEIESNPLRKYFDEEGLDLHSASEDESPEPAMDANILVDADDECDDEDDDEDKDDDDVPAPSKAAFQRREVSALKPSAPVLGKRPVGEEDSVTESESEEESPNPNNSSSIPPKPPIKLTNNVEDSVTESESESGSDAEIAPLNRPRLGQATTPGCPSKKTSSPTADDSVTESESDLEPDLNPKLHPKPGFPLGPRQKHEKALVLDEEKGIKVPGVINTYLRDYQRNGVKFLWKQYNQGCGGLLGDDMGLDAEHLLTISFSGKTIQIISFLSAIMQKSGLITDKHRRQKYVSELQDTKEWRKHKKLPKADAKWPTCLIIAPSTVVHNWAREFDTWGYFEVGLYNGNRKEREVVINDFKLGRLDVVVTTFELARRDIDVLDDLPWSCVIVDEVHRVKNETAKITRAYHLFGCLRRFGLTGTAIQNSYTEMWTILDWTNPGKLGTSGQWKGYIVKPLTNGQSTRASEEARAQALVVARVLRDKLLPNFFLRRTKDIIKDQLPQKTDQVVFCPLTERQISAYKNLLNTEAVQNLIKRDEPCDCGTNKSRKACCHPFVAGDVFRYMSILIKLSNHLGLILPGPNDSAEQTARNRALAELAFPEGNIPKFGTAMMKPQFCGKWASLEALLKEWRKDKTNKVLIFTKSVKLLDMLDFHLNTRNYGFLKLDGSTKQADRMPMIDKFNNDPDVYIFLISTLAGGTGLNLTGANKVVIFDPNWNPAHDLQAMDRAFRFGQTRDVAVYRLLGAGSVEELIYARQIYKQQQMAIGYEASVQTRYFEGIQGDNSNKGELFGINNIFRLHEDKLATKMAIEKATLAELDWALANLDAGTQKGKKTAKTANELVEADTKIVKDDIVGNMKGLGALLFDDAPPILREQDIIQKTLSSIGVRYSHMNDEILVPSRIEAERTKKILNERRPRKSKGKTKEKEPSPKPQWPPKRNRKNPSPTPEQQLHTRHKALIRLGMIDGPEDVPAFARRFSSQSVEAQRGIIAELDAWVKEQGMDEDSSD